MVEIYNERLQDLMADRLTNLQIREASSGFFSMFVSLLSCYVYRLTKIIFNFLMLLFKYQIFKKFQ